jgi:hypothetical protein
MILGSTLEALLSTLAPLALLSSLLVSTGCTPPDELTDEDLDVTPADELRWDELTGGRDAVDADDADGDGHGPGNGARSDRRSGERLAPDLSALPPPAPIDPRAHALLPADLRSQPRLAQLAVARGLEKPIAYEGGVFGLVGPAKLIVATSDRIKDDVRLYWVMVKVLSEKYGCFMVAKQTVGATTRATCRDQRRVVFWKTRGPGWVQFHARQYDRDGYEIVVRQKRIVRVSQGRVLY